MDKGLVGIIIFLVLITPTIYYYATQTSGIPKTQTHGAITTIKYSNTYTKIVSTTTNTLGETTYYETYIATYVKPAEYSTISLQLFAKKPASPADYNDNIGIYYAKTGLILVYHEYLFPTVTDHGTTYPGEFYESYSITKKGTNYYGIHIGFDAMTTTLNEEQASRIYNSYLSIINAFWKQINFAPVMTITYDDRTYYATIKPTDYSKIYANVNVQMKGFMVLEEPITCTFGPQTSAVFPQGTYYVDYWFKIWGESPETITTTVTYTRVG